MIDQSFLNNLSNLSPQEKTFIGKFQSDPTGATFMPVADLLRMRGFVEEAIVLLEDGLSRFPKYSSARAALAKEYYSQGLLDQALNQAKQVLADSPDNAQAHRLLVRLLVLFDNRDELLNRLRSTERIIPDDDMTSSIRKAIEKGDWIAAQKWVRSELERSGVPIRLPGDSDSLSSPGSPAAPPGGFPSGTSIHTEASQPSHAEIAGAWQVPRPDLKRPTPLIPRAGAKTHTDFEESEKLSEDGLPEALRPGSNLAHIRGDVDRYLLLRGFRSLPIEGFFSGRDGLMQSSGVEPLTLAEIYRSQGMYLRAMEIYERLLRESPRKIEYQAAFAELKEALKKNYLDAGSSVEDLSNEQVKEAKKKIQKLRQLIGRLNEEPGRS